VGLGGRDICESPCPIDDLRHRGVQRRPDARPELVDCRNEAIHRRFGILAESQRRGGSSDTAEPFHQPRQQ
jgi:hypothetical protein